MSLTALRLSISVDFANSLRIPTSSPFSAGRGPVDSESPDVDGAGGCPLCSLDGPAAAVAIVTAGVMVMV